MKIKPAAMRISSCLGLPTVYRIDWVGFARVGERFRMQAMQKMEVIHE